MKRGTVVAICVGVLAIVAAVVHATYPQDALKCKSSLTRPDTDLICPEFRNEWCVKEVVLSMPRDLCGATAFFGDTWDEKASQCIYKKCEAECTEGDYEFEFDNIRYTRRRFCCNTDKCNGSVSRWQAPRFLLLGLLPLVALAIERLWRAD